MRKLISRALLAGTLSLALAAACGYSPNFADDMLKCGSSNTCPDGYTCRSGLCAKTGGGGGGAGGSANLANFVGHWVFTAAQSTRTRECTDGSSETTTP